MSRNASILLEHSAENVKALFPESTVKACKVPSECIISLEAVNQQHIDNAVNHLMRNGLTVLAIAVETL